MAQQAIIQLRHHPIQGVTVIDLLPHELTEPDQATAMGEGLRSLITKDGSTRLLINASATKYMSSTAFAVLFSVGKYAEECGGRIAICDMDSFVKLGAGIIKLGRMVPIFEDEATAIASLIL